MPNDSGLRSSRTACKTVQWENIWCANPPVHSNGVPNKKLLHKLRGQGGELTSKNMCFIRSHKLNSHTLKSRIKYWAAKLNKLLTQTTDTVTFRSVRISLNCVKEESMCRSKWGSGTCPFLYLFSCFNPRDSHTHHTTIVQLKRLYAWRRVGARVY